MAFLFYLRLISFLLYLGVLKAVPPQPTRIEKEEQDGRTFGNCLHLSPKRRELSLVSVAWSPATQWVLGWAQSLLLPFADHIPTLGGRSSCLGSTPSRSCGRALTSAGLLLKWPHPFLSKSAPTHHCCPQSCSVLFLPFMNISSTFIQVFGDYLLEALSYPQPLKPTTMGLTGTCWMTE